MIFRHLWNESHCRISGIRSKNYGRWKNRGNQYRDRMIVSFLFILVIKMVPASAVSLILILIGVLMLPNIVHISMDDLMERFPALLIPFNVQHGNRLYSIPIDKALHREREGSSSCALYDRNSVYKPFSYSICILRKRLNKRLYPILTFQTSNTYK